MAGVKLLPNDMRDGRSKLLPNDMSTTFNKRELLRMIALVAVVWVAILFGLSKWQRSRPASRDQGPQLVHYPGTEQVEEQTSPNIGLRKYWFQLNEEYPSKSVYYFYQRQLGPQGWKLLGAAEPRWGRVVEGDERVDLQMMSVVKPVKGKDPLAGEERQPGIQAFVTLRRAMHPGLLMREPSKPSQGEGVGPSE
jgi:hypothetical protein